jgi:hypothetical protein
VLARSRLKIAVLYIYEINRCANCKDLTVKTISMYSSYRNCTLCYIPTVDPELFLLDPVSAFLSYVSGPILFKGTVSPDF